ncbi:MAG: polymer-forming cytoskeletal protein, partial [Bacillota bacterium]
QSQPYQMSLIIIKQGASNLIALQTKLARLRLIISIIDEFKNGGCLKMGVKNNFSQAVSELIGISRNTEPEETEQPEEIMMTEASDEEDKDQNEILEAEEEDENEVKQPTVMKVSAPASSNGANPKERIMAMLAQQQAQQQVQPQAETQPQPQVQVQPSQQIQQPQTQRLQPEQPGEAPGLTTIAKGTVIIGEINADGDVELLGSVKGKVASRGDIRANGKVIGDLIGKDIELVACAVQGNITASGLVTVDGDSVVIGDVKSENFCLDGKIKGNVSVEKEAKFQPKAILAGNVTTASIAMSQGAKIQGEVNIPLSEKETDMSFDVDIII